MIKAIVFDFGGVLVNLDQAACIKAFDGIGYPQIREVLDPWHQKGFYSDLEEGKISPDEFRAIILKDASPDAKPEDVDNCMGALLTGVEPYKADVLNDLSKKYDLYLLTNNNPISMKRCHDALEEVGIDWRHVFKDEFISCYMKMLKPSAEIFNEAVRRIGLPADEIMFIDDSQSNVDGAAAVGIRAVFYSPEDDLGEVVEANL